MIYHFNICEKYYKIYCALTLADDFCILTYQI